ncbi:MAG: FRG domain-containing protein [Proteobacteria bacterium]|nr:FRG domain-containing protein [Pseudomonadota bacterium]
MPASFFWTPFETVINNYADLVAAIDGVLNKAKTENKQFAWRGQVNAGWALHSSLYRRLKLTLGLNPVESKFSSEEQGILANLHRWGLHNTQGRGRLSILNQLAMLQHFGAPTRLIDVSFNAWVGVFFAVEQKWSNAVLSNENDDARLFAIDVTNKLINEQANRRDWEDAYSRPWTDQVKIDPKEWTTSFFAWKPPSLDARISAQNGGFIFGGVPSATGPNNTRFQFPKSADYTQGWWPIDTGRGACSLALRPHKFSANIGAIPNSACYTFRISAAAKQDIRKRLELMFGYKHSTIYPDYTGFSDFAVSHLKRW